MQPLLGQAATRGGNGTCVLEGRLEAGDSEHTFCRRRKSTAERLGRSPGSEWLHALPAASPSPADGRVVDRSGVLSHSGGTAPDSHRTSLLCPSWAPRYGS